LAYGAEVRRQPVTEVDETVHPELGGYRSVSISWR